MGKKLLCVWDMRTSCCLSKLWHTLHEWEKNDYREKRERGVKGRGWTLTLLVTIQGSDCGLWEAWLILCHIRKPFRCWSQPAAMKKWHKMIRHPPTSTPCPPPPPSPSLFSSFCGASPFSSLTLKTHTGYWHMCDWKCDVETQSHVPNHVTQQELPAAINCV